MIRVGYASGFFIRFLPGGLAQSSTQLHDRSKGVFETPLQAWHRPGDGRKLVRADEGPQHGARAERPAVGPAQAAGRLLGLSGVHPGELVSLPQNLHRCSMGGAMMP